MRLVDGKQGHADRTVQAFQQVEETPGQQALGRDIDEVALAGEQVALDGVALLGRLRRIEKGRLDAGLEQRRDLVLHQRDQRRNDNAGTRAQQCGDLVAQRFAPARGHQHQAIPASDDVIDNLCLRAAKSRVTEDFL